MSSETGVVTWLEVPVASVSRAAKFYADVLGWESAAASGDDAGNSYPSSLVHVESLHMFSRGDLHGAFLKVPESDTAIAAQPGKIGNQGVVVTYRVDSIEETLAKVEKAGGRIHVPKTEIGGGMGCFARFIDSEGNLQGVWSQN